MQFSQLRTFIAIAREQNLTRAAESLHLSQSAISSQLKGLEESLGVSLFERSTRGMVLSDAGSVLLEHAEEILAASADMQRSAEALRRGTTSSVTIGLNTDPTFLRISALTQRLTVLHADLNVIFHASESTTTAQQLKAGLIDLGFFYGSLTDPEIAQQIVTEVRICVAIPRRLVASGTPRDWDGLSGLPWIWVDDKFPFYQVLATKLGYITRPPNNIVTASNEQIVRELVVSGQGVALMREDEARPLAAEGRVVLWEHGWSSIPLKLAWLREKDNLRRIRNVRDAVGHIWTPKADPEGSLSDKAWA